MVVSIVVIASRCLVRKMDFTIIKKRQDFLVRTAKEVKCHGFETAAERASNKRLPRTQRSQDKFSTESADLGKII